MLLLQLLRGYDCRYEIPWPCGPFILLFIIYIFISKSFCNSHNYEYAKKMDSPYHTIQVRAFLFTTAVIFIIQKICHYTNVSEIETHLTAGFKFSAPRVVPPYATCLPPPRPCHCKKTLLFWQVGCNMKTSRIMSGRKIENQSHCFFGQQRKKIRKQP